MNRHCMKPNRHYEEPNRHCEEQRDEAISQQFTPTHEIAALRSQ
jgi:hypothetical protein